MTQPAIVPVILCGGSGTRLWPLSRKSFPKQFVPLIGEKSLLRLTAERLANISPSPAASLLCVAAEDHRFLVADDLKAAGARGDLLLEPAGRNTAAA
ncbi:MAG: mannose-1-phosphate guanylyltransferase/mannose-6-phosphate isomerase, partial [Burkholderiales bacterium]